MISVPETISWFSCLCIILFCAPLISACTLYLFLPSPDHLLFSPAAPLTFSIILTLKICQKILPHVSLCHFRLTDSPLELKNWSNSEHGWGKESAWFSSSRCIGKKQNDLLPHSDGKIQAGYKNRSRETFKRTFTQATSKSLYCPIFLLPSTPSELLTYMCLCIH